MTSLPSCRHGWRLQWVGDDALAFEVQQEDCGLTDESMQDWGDWMDAQLERRFGAEDWPPLIASSLDFSKNALGDEAVHHIVEYLRHRGISPELLKFGENKIGDRGAASIGRLLATTREPVHEVHLAHNRITELGVRAILEAIAESGSYPFGVEAEGQGRSGESRKMPVWMQLEFNSIQWSVLEYDLDPQVRWSTGDSNSDWPSKGAPPMVCLHSSFKSQARGAEEIGATLGALASDDVPLWIFLDASALRRFTAAPSQEADAEESLFTFQGLLNLCRQGHMACVPEDDRSMPSWLGDVHEQDRLIFLVTEATLEELAREDAASGQQEEFCEWLCSAPNSYVQVCQQWGILEVVETKLHKELVKLGGMERRAVALQVSRWALNTFDIALLWASQAGSEGHVVVATAEQGLCSFAAEFAAAGGKSACGVTVVHLDQLERSFKLDQAEGGSWLHAAAQQADAAEYCGALLSAQLVRSLVVEQPLAGLPHSAGAVATAAAAAERGEASLRPRDADAHAAACGEASLRTPAGDTLESDEVGALRKQLAEASALLADAQELLEAGAPPIIAASCAEKIKAAQLRFQALLNQPS